MLSCVWLSVTLWTVDRQTSRPQDFSGKNTGVGCHFLLQGNFSTQGSNLHLLHCRQILYPLSYRGSPSLLGHNFCGLGVQTQFSGALCFRMPYKHLSRYWRVMIFSEESTRETSPSELAYMVFGKIQLLASYQIDNLSSSLALGWSLPSVLCQMGLSKMLACFIKVHKLRKQYRKNVSNREVPFFCKWW